MRERKVVYVHFSFRRKRGENKVILASCLFADAEAKTQIARRVVKDYVWIEDNQYIGGVQAYQFALECISKWQGQLLKHNVTEVCLVTDNSVLHKWILEPLKSNRTYRDYIQYATKDYRTFGNREIVLDVNILDPRDYESSFKYCKNENVEEDRTAGRIRKDPLSSSRIHKKQKENKKENKEKKTVFLLPEQMKKETLDIF